MKKMKILKVVMKMSKYTITIKNLINNKFDFKMTDYPIFDENYREVLETKILKHFYFREIGFETFALWKFKLNEKLNTRFQSLRNHG